MSKTADRSEEPQYQNAELHFYSELMNRSAAAPEIDNSWLITLADVLLLLLVFFIVFSVVMKKSNNPGTIEQGELAEEVVEEEPELSGKLSPIGEIIRNQIASDIKTLDLENDIFVVATNSEIVITLKERVAFRPARTAVLEDSKPILDNIARIIMKYPNFLIEINGHTDNIPIKTNRFPSNWELSVARATSVVKYFINNHSFDPSRFAVRGNADMKPVAPNDTPENRAKNRRVEIRLTETSPQT